MTDAGGPGRTRAARRRGEGEMQDRTDRAVGRGHIHVVVGDQRNGAQFLFFNRDHLPMGFTLEAGGTRPRLVCNLNEWIRPEMVQDARGSIGDGVEMVERTIPVRHVDLSIHGTKELDVVVKNDNDQITVVVDVRIDAEGELEMTGTFGADSLGTRHRQMGLVIPNPPSGERRGEVIEIRHTT